MLVGYVSDEWYSALADVNLEFEGDGTAMATRSTASGAVRIDLPLGRYNVSLAKPGYVPKRVDVAIDSPAAPYQFRLLSTATCGYVWPKCLKAGERAEVRVNCANPFSLQLWRYGWEREFVHHLGDFEDHPPGANLQILPDGDFSQNGVRWSELGYATPSFDPRLRVQAPNRSGLYYFHLIARTGEFFSFPWVVAADKPTARIAVLASNITWNAYNDYGGRSNYTACHGLAPVPTLNPRQENIWFTDPNMPVWNALDYPPLSFDRPEPLNRTAPDEVITDPIARIGAEHVAPAEWRLLGWLEREGFLYDLYAETQLHDELFDLRDYTVLVLNTHPEYWTSKMYRAVKNWVFEEGGKLAYLGGNGIHCQVEIQDDSTMVVQNLDWGVDHHGNDSRFHLANESSAPLLGVATTMAGYETGAPFQVLDASHWAFTGTSLSNGDLFGTQSLDCRARGGASGHETDKMVDASPATAVRLAKGTNPDGGGAAMVYFDTPSGGAVFSASSISYTCSIAVDPQISRVTANVLRRFLA
jgi:hypothetical protein